MSRRPAHHVWGGVLIGFAVVCFLIAIVSCAQAASQ